MFGTPAGSDVWFDRNGGYCFPVVFYDIPRPTWKFDSPVKPTAEIARSVGWFVSHVSRQLYSEDNKGMCALNTGCGTHQYDETIRTSQELPDMAQVLFYIPRRLSMYSPRRTAKRRTRKMLRVTLFFYYSGHRKVELCY